MACHGTVHFLRPFGAAPLLPSQVTLLFSQDGIACVKPTMGTVVYGGPRQPAPEAASGQHLA